MHILIVEKNVTLLEKMKSLVNQTRAYDTSLKYGHHVLSKHRAADIILKNKISALYNIRIPRLLYHQFESIKL